jgi:predicted nucleotide-binding protein (sugar kinase/HSP70/actin superfamily)
MGSGKYMESNKVVTFKTLGENVGKFRLGKKTVLVPAMNQNGAHLFSATFRGFGVNARVLETFKGLDLGMEYTSGKECYPCQITLGDILHFVKTEKEKLGEAFNPSNYVYFLPESDGPCRFGLYNKFQRIVLDSFEGLEKLKISALTTRDGYSLQGLLEKKKVLDFRKAAYFSLVVADVLDRLLWRIRPYEKEPGMADEFIERAMHALEESFETYGPAKKFDKILEKLEELIVDGKSIIDPTIPPKPLIGVVGEIFVRMHTDSNQNILRLLEKHGAEVVNASLCEWVNYVSYDSLRTAKAEFVFSLRQLRLRRMKDHLKQALSFWLDLYYQQMRQKQTYKRVSSLIDIADDHNISHLEEILKEGNIYSFDVGTEACLSIASIIACARDGYNGMVNVYPFTCMPSTTTSAIVKPLMSKLGVPYLDAAYDSSVQPGREAAIRTFMYQAHQHFKRHGRKSHAGDHHGSAH